MRVLVSSEEWVIRQLVDGPNNPHKLWKADAPCTDQQLSNILHRLERLGLVHGDQSRSQFKGPGRGRKYWLDRALQDFLPTASNDPHMSEALKVLEQAVSIRGDDDKQWYTALTLALINHTVNSGRRLLWMKGPVKENIRREVLGIVEVIAPMAIQGSEGAESVNLYYVLLEQQLERVRHFANKSHDSQERAAVLRELAAIKLKNENSEAEDEIEKERAIAEMQRTGKMMR